jgi:drug/metabolite transporter (DMT)-like permease
MTVPDQTAQARQRTILLVLGAAAAFVVSSVLVKALAGALPLAQVVFARNVFTLPLLFLMAMRAGGLHLLRPRRPMLHAQRAFFGIFGMIGAFHGFTWLPLATATALGFTMPLFLTALSVLLLRQKVGWRRWTAVVVGFAGVLLIARPGMDGTTLPAFSVGMVLMGALAWALAMMSIRRMGDAGENGIAIVVWFAVIGSVVTGVVAIPFWEWPTATQWLMLVGIGTVSGFAQMMMTEAYRRGEATLLVPFEYSAIIWTALFGILFWSEWPQALDLLGYAVLVGAGLFIWWREVRLGVTR